MRALLASPLGLLIGLSLGALGGGGSILAVPALVYAAGQPAKGATTTSLILVAITSLIGLAPHWRTLGVQPQVGDELVGTREPAEVPNRGEDGQRHYGLDQREARVGSEPTAQAGERAGPHAGVIRAARSRA